MFSIWTNGIADCLNLTPGAGTARLTSLSERVVLLVIPAVTSPTRDNGTHLHKATPSFNPSRRSPPGRRSPSVPSIHDFTSFAAAGVYLSRRNLRKSLSNDETDAIS